MSLHTRTRRARYARIILMAIVGLAAAHVDKARAAVSASAHLGQAKLATAGDLAAGRVLGGLTAQQLPMIATLSSNGRKMDTEVVFGMHCTSGDLFTTPDGWIRIRVPSSGVVHASGAIAPVPASSAKNDAITGGLDTLNGKLNPKRGIFSGSWELQLNYVSATGQSDACDSGRVSFTVRL